MKRVGSLRQKFTRRLSLPVTRREKKGKSFTRLRQQTCDEVSVLSTKKSFYEHRRDSSVDIESSPLIMIQDDMFDGDDDVFAPTSDIKPSKESDHLSVSDLYQIDSVYQSTTTGLEPCSGQWGIIQNTFTKATREFNRWT